MNLNEKMQDLLKQPEQILVGKYGHDTIYGKEQLEKIRELISEDETFKGCDEINFLSYPVVEVTKTPIIPDSLLQEEKKVMMVKTYKWEEGLKFSGKAYILSLALTPKMYDPSQILKPIKNGAGLSPVLYNPENFEPVKKIILEFSPDRPQDGITNHEEVIRQELHDLLDKVLDNPENYLMEGKRGLLIRGIFEMESDDSNTKESSTTYLTQVEESLPKEVGSLVFYLETEEIEDGEFKTHVRSKFIPEELKDKFQEKFGDRQSSISITKKEIDDFLEENKINSDNKISPYTDYENKFGS